MNHPYKTSTSNGNRETWLQHAVRLMTPEFVARGYKVPEVRVSCGFPSRSATSARKRRIGECWSTNSAKDARAQIFITPLLEDHVTVLATLVHEVVHAVVGNDHGHDKVFKKCATGMGLTGKMTSTVAGPESVKMIEGWMKKLGAYPHAQLSVMTKTTQSTRLIKCQCEECGYTIRTTAKWIATLGAPKCPCNDETMEVK